MLTTLLIILGIIVLLVIAKVYQPAFNAKVESICHGVKTTFWDFFTQPGRKIR